MATSAVQIPNGAALRLGQWLGLAVVLTCCGTLIFATTDVGRIRTLVLFCVVATAGLFLCRATEVHLKDERLGVLGYLWLAKLVLTFLFLYVGWIPQLDPAFSTSWGYDPQRYYVQAQELVQNDWVPDFLRLNYVGVLYYYGAVFRVFGYNPVSPAMVNVLVTLVATLYLVRFGYELEPERKPADWTLGLALLLPEIVWFDVMTSRETLVGALLLIALLTVARYASRSAKIPLLRVLLVSGIATAGVAFVRTSMIIPIVGAVVLMLLLVRPQGRRQSIQRVVLALAAAVVIAAGPSVANYVGGFQFDVVSAIQQATSATANIASSDDAVRWNENSLGRLLMPDNAAEAVAFVLPRGVFYLVAPLPRFSVTLDGLFAGNWNDWQLSLILMSSLINVVAAPYALASLLVAIKQRRRNSGPLALHISCWTTYVAVAGGNLMIHERYRLVATLLFWGCAWLGVRNAPKNLLTLTTVCWYGLLACGALFYLLYKST